MKRRGTALFSRVEDWAVRNGYEFVDDNLWEIADLIQEELNRAADEAYEEAARLVERRGKRIGGAIDPMRTACELRTLRGR